VQYGPASTRLKSRTLTPFKAPGIIFLPSRYRQQPEIEITLEVYQKCFETKKEQN
jgi:hypothetical protein